MRADDPGISPFDETRPTPAQSGPSTTERKYPVPPEAEWAVDIVSECFTSGLQKLLEPAALKGQLAAFKAREDSVYSTLLDAIENRAVSEVFVTHWVLGQTLATKSRTWLEDAVTRILIEGSWRTGQAKRIVLTQWFLETNGLAAGRALSDLGERFPEWLDRRARWEAPLSRSILEVIDLAVGREERERAERWGSGKRAWQERTPWGGLSEAGAERCRRERETLAIIANTPPHGPEENVLLRCNLLVIEPQEEDNAPHAWAFRFVNPKVLSSHAKRKDERANLLRVYAVLRAAKWQRPPASLRLLLAELVPREAGWAESDPHPDYFTPETYLPAEEFWKFLGVPFAVVPQGIARASSTLREHLVRGLTSIFQGEADLRREKRP